MPAEYPFKPPAFVMLTPSGRFETGTKICLSISSFHPESWQPSWSVRSALIALIAFMQTPGNGAVGSLESPSEARKSLAKEARDNPPKHSNPERQELINSLHQQMLEMEEKSRSLYLQNSSNASKDNDGSVKEDEEVGALENEEGEEATTSNEKEENNESSPLLPAAVQTTEEFVGQPSSSPPQQQEEQGEENRNLETINAQPPPPLSPQQHYTITPETHPNHHQSWEDKGLTYLALLLGVLLVAVLLRRAVVAFSSGESNDAVLFSVNPSAADIEL